MQRHMNGPADRIRRPCGVVILAVMLDVARNTGDWAPHGLCQPAILDEAVYELPAANSLLVSEGRCRRATEATSNLEGQVGSMEPLNSAPGCKVSRHFRLIRLRYVQVAEIKVEIRHPVYPLTENRRPRALPVSLFDAAATAPAPQRPGHVSRASRVAQSVTKVVAKGMIGNARPHPLLSVSACS